ncbi:MAG: MbcA/ParS/Xre antitoxin family protein [Candidatus Korobacteraceae bacterium]
MKRAQTKPKRVVSGKTKLSGIRDSTGEFGGELRSGTNLSTVVKKAHLDSRVMEYAEVLAHAVETFGSRIRANAWLNRPSRIFNNQSPLQVLTQDPAAVEEELVRIDHGMFA